MRYTRRMISFVLITFLVGLGSLMLSTSQVRADDDVTCNIEIVKEAFPADDTEFDFLVTGGPLGFILKDPSDPSFAFVFGGDKFVTITITEEVPPGWILDNIVCVEGTSDCGSGEFEPCLRITIDEETNSITATCEDDDEGSCTFFNSQQPPPTVPTLSEWGLIAMAGVLGIVGFMVMRRRKVTA